MTVATIFVSSVQKELAAERRAVRAFVEGDALLRRFFTVFLFEDLPAADVRADAAYFDQVDRSSIYVGFFGNEYGSENAQGASPTEREFDRATQQTKPRLIFVRGTVFELVDQALDFVMSKIARRVGTRALGPEAPVDYELPREAVAEAIVNAVAHRDYASNASVQVMLFADRLEVWNPGELPPSLTVAGLRQPHASIPRNPLIADPMFLAKYAEKAGTGILDMITRCKQAGLPTPEFRQSGGQFMQVMGRLQTGEVTPEVTPEVRLVRALTGEMTRQQLQTALTLKDDDHFRTAFLQPALDAGLIEMTIPDKPTSSKQKYRRTAKGTLLGENPPAGGGAR